MPALIANGLRVLSRKASGVEEYSPARKSYVGRWLRDAAIEDN